MECLQCDTHPQLSTRMTSLGVQIDRCTICSGVWFDKGEIFHFVKNPSTLQRLFDTPRTYSKATHHNCLRCKNLLNKEQFVQPSLWTLECPHCGGMWIAKEPLATLILIGSPKSFRSQEQLATQSTPHASKAIAPRVRITSLPNFMVRAAATLSTMYFILFAVIFAVVHFSKLPTAFIIPIYIIVIILQFVFSPMLTDWSLQFFNSMHWMPQGMCPQHLQIFIAKTCAKHKIPFPRMGIINDQTPNAFTYGHTPYNARIVITQGLIDRLNEDELECVIAHEIGHARNWDMMIMTMASVVPIILYELYKTLVRTRNKDDEKKQGSAGWQLALIAWIGYIISHYAMLFLSRTREYQADRFAGMETKKPNALSSALVKIAYGMAAQPPSVAQNAKEQNAKEQNANPRTNLVRNNPLGIFEPKGALSMAFASINVTNANNIIPNETAIRRSMQWDLWNPWARFYEFGSTHPLTAKRIIANNTLAETLKQTPFVEILEDRYESYWDEFFIDLFFYYAPVIGIAIGIYISWLLFGFHKQVFGIIMSNSIIGFALGYLIQTYFTYGAKAKEVPYSIAGLLSHVKVSAIRGIPAILKGTFVGRGIPGLIWSEDMTLQDKTGLILCDYEQPLGLWNFLFGLLRTKKYIGEEVMIQGWYRRAPHPYFEIKAITSKKFGRKLCYTPIIRVLFPLLLMPLALWIRHKFK